MNNKITVLSNEEMIEAQNNITKESRYIRDCFSNDGFDFDAMLGKVINNEASLEDFLSRAQALSRMKYLKLFDKNLLSGLIYNGATKLFDGKNNRNYTLHYKIPEKPGFDVERLNHPGKLTEEMIAGFEEIQNLLDKAKKGFFWEGRIRGKYNDYSSEFLTAVYLIAARCVFKSKMISDSIETEKFIDEALKISICQNILLSTDKRDNTDKIFKNIVNYGLEVGISLCNKAGVSAESICEKDIVMGFPPKMAEEHLILALTAEKDGKASLREIYPLSQEMENETLEDGKSVAEEVKFEKEIMNATKPEPDLSTRMSAVIAPVIETAHEIEFNNDEKSECENKITPNDLQIYLAEIVDSLYQGVYYPKKDSINREQLKPSQVVQITLGAKRILANPNKSRKIFPICEAEELANEIQKTYFEPIIKSVFNGKEEYMSSKGRGVATIGHEAVVSCYGSRAELEKKLRHMTKDYIVKHVNNSRAEHIQ